MTFEQEQKKSLESVAVLYLVGALVAPWLFEKAIASLHEAGGSF